MEEKENRNDTVTISMKDLFAEFLVHWKIIICLGIIFALLMGAISYVRSGSTPAETEVASSSGTVAETDTSDEAVQEARAKLTEAQAENVDNVYANFKAYYDNKTAIQDYIRDSALFVDHEVDPVLKTTKYYLTTDVMDIDSYFSDMSLSMSDWGEIQQILQYTEGDSVDGIRNMITFYNVDSQGYVEVNLGSGSSSSANGIYHTILSVSVLADGTEQCDKIAEVVDRGIQLATQELYQADGVTTITTIGSNYNDDVDDVTIYVRNKQQSLMGYANTIMVDIYNLRQYEIAYFTEDQSAYFNLLQARDNQAEAADADTGDGTDASKQRPTPARSVSGKYVAVGAVIGILLGMLFVMLAYIFRKKVKTVNEISERWGLPVLDSYFFEKKTRDPFKLWARRLRGRNADCLATKAVMLAEDIRILAEKNNITDIFVQSQADDKEAAQVLQALSGNLSDTGIRISGGDALRDPEQLKAMSEADGVIAFVHLRQTGSDSMNRYIEFCARYASRVLGAVAVATTPE